MKRDAIIVTVSLSIVAALIFGFYICFSELTIETVLLLVFFAIMFTIGINKLRKKVSGETVEDELSKKIKFKAGYWSFFFSLYLWFIIALLDNFHIILTRKLFFYGYLGMMALYAIFWLIFRFKGKVNE